MRRPTAALVPCAVLAALAACGPSGLRVPELGPVPPLPDWPDDPPTEAKRALGERLYLDPRLSGSGHTSCASCHLPSTAFQDSIPLPAPDSVYPRDEPRVPRNTPSLLGLVYAPVFRWDGAMTDLVDVMAFPFGEVNMNLGPDAPSARAALAQRLTVAAPEYVGLFRDAFGAELGSLPPADVWRLAGRALAHYARAAVSRDAPFDRWNAGDDGAMSAAAVRGLEVFRGSGRCIGCHGGPLFSDFGFHNLSLDPPRADGTRADEGRWNVTHDEADRGKFLTPTLRSTYDTSPYFHDGSRAGLRDVLAHFASPAVQADPNHDPAFDPPLALTEGEVADLVALLQALRGGAP
jgi:cytochrome c peroxidase